MSFAPVPATAAWHHRGARSRFEVAYFQADGDRCRIEGQAAAIEDGVPWAVEHAIEVDAAGATRRRRWRPKARAGPCRLTRRSGTSWRRCWTPARAAWDWEDQQRTRLQAFHYAARDKRPPTR